MLGASIYDLSIPGDDVAAADEKPDWSSIVNTTAPAVTPPVTNPPGAKSKVTGYIVFGGVTLVVLFLGAKMLKRKR
jgi:hypothetical protein